MICKMNHGNIFNWYNYLLGTLWQHILQRDGVTSKNSNIWQKVDINRYK
jgi:hypothetical protein